MRTSFRIYDAGRGARAHFTACESQALLGPGSPSLGPRSSRPDPIPILPAIRTGRFQSSVSLQFSQMIKSQGLLCTSLAPKKFY